MDVHGTFSQEIPTILSLWVPKKSSPEAATKDSNRKRSAVKDGRFCNQTLKIEMVLGYD